MDQIVEILLVEDNPYEARLTIRSLKKNNVTNNLLHLSDGAEALDFLFARNKYIDRKVENVPNIILLDLKLPKISGLEVLKAVKSDERTKLIPIIVLTSSNEEKDITLSYQLGANSYIVKPVDFDSFSTAIANLGMYWMLLNAGPHKR